MRKKIVAGNWKMNKLKSEALSLVDEVLKLLENVSLSETKQVIFSPPSVYLDVVSQKSGNKEFVSSCSQNIYFENTGAFTGEIAATMVKDLGAKFTLVGHSERRTLFSETNADLAKKVDAAIENNLSPIFCCGEQLDDRKNDNYFSVVKSQIEEGLFHLSPEDFQKVVIAYEPVWAIGTGETATSEQAQEMHAYIRLLINSKYGEEMADNTTILYGGSCKPSNAKELFNCPDVDGGLIGGASLVAEDFVAIVKAL